MSKKISSVPREPPMPVTLTWEEYQALGTREITGIPRTSQPTAFEQWNEYLRALRERQEPGHIPIISPELAKGEFPKNEIRINFIPTTYPILDWLEAKEKEQRQKEEEERKRIAEMLARFGSPIF